ncbi:hypothetical protein HanPSC8_Chr04g0180751 [Helianthus annuus]|nr:hypothetical protein HanPSC8_Chr04g0180751 [Helianthus annuus]
MLFITIRNRSNFESFETKLYCVPASRIDWANRRPAHVINTVSNSTCTSRSLIASHGYSVSRQATIIAAWKNKNNNTHNRSKFLKMFQNVRCSTNPVFPTLLVAFGSSTKKLLERSNGHLSFLKHFRLQKNSFISS